MFRSFRINAPFGLLIRVQILFVVLFSALSGFVLYEEGLGRGLGSVLLLTAAFLFVFLHEVGHAIAARWLGIKVVDITIWPLGGMARLEDVPKSGRIEFVIAIAGPLVNLVLAGAFLAANWALAWGEAAYTFYLLGWMNLLLAGFNLLPAYPLDGGRVVRAALCGLMPFDRATVWSVRISRLIAVALLAASLYYGLYVVSLIAGFVLFAAGQADSDEEEFDGDAEGHANDESGLTAPRRWEFLRPDPGSPPPSAAARPGH